MSHLSKNSEEHGMKRRNGFSLLELMVSMAVTITVLGAATAALLQAQHATQAIAMQANTQENLRAGMHFMVRDIAQAGEGIPQGGITIPYGATSLVNRPGIAGTFPTTYTAIPAITPGSQLGQFATSINPNTNLPLVSGTRTDIINILYNDDTLADAVGNHLYSFPVVQAAPAVPVCAGVISPTGAFVTMTPACFLMPGVVQPISAGNLIMFHNQNGTAIGPAGELSELSGSGTGESAARHRGYDRRSVLQLRPDRVERRGGRLPAGSGQCADADPSGHAGTDSGRKYFRGGPVGEYLY